MDAAAASSGAGSSCGLGAAVAREIVRACRAESPPHAAAGDGADGGADAAGGVIWFRSAGGATASAAAAPAARASRVAAIVHEEGGASAAEDAFPLPVADEDLAALVRAVEWIGATPAALDACRVVQTTVGQPLAADREKIKIDPVFVAEVLGPAGTDSIAQLLAAEVLDRTVPWEVVAEITVRAARLAEGLAFLGVVGADAALLIGAAGICRRSLSVTGTEQFNAIVADTVNGDTRAAVSTFIPGCAGFRGDRIAVVRSSLSELHRAAWSTTKIVDLCFAVGYKPGLLIHGFRYIWNFPPNTASFTLSFEDGTVVDSYKPYTNAIKYLDSVLPAGCTLRAVGATQCASIVALACRCRNFAWREDSRRRVELVELSDPRGRRYQYRDTLVDWLESGAAAPPGGELDIYFVPEAVTSRPDIPVPNRPAEGVGDAPQMKPATGPVTIYCCRRVRTLRVGATSDHYRAALAEFADEIADAQKKWGDAARLVPADAVVGTSGSAPLFIPWPSSLDGEETSPR